MATSIYLGNPPENIKKWIEENYKPDMTKVPLTFTAEEAGAKLSLQSSNGPAVTLETSPTGEEGSWTPYEIGTEITFANVGDKVMFRNSSDEIQIMSASNMEYHLFQINSGKIAASGNIMFLMDKTGELRDLSGKDYCYHGMFENCSALTQAPALPATTLAGSCYVFMFSGCESLTQAPALPATTLAEGCYSGMFQNCKLPFTFSDKTFDEVANLIQEEYLIGEYWYYFDENYNEIKINPVEIICSDKTMLATFDENEWTWTITEK